MQRQGSHGAQDAPRPEGQQTEGALHQDGQFSEEIINSLPGIFYILDEGRKFVRWNRKFCAVSGYSAEELARMDALQIFEPETAPRILEGIEEVFRQGEAEVQAPLLTKDGRRIPHHFTGRRTSFKGKTYLVGLGTDISRQQEMERRLRESEERFRMIADHIPQLAWMADENGSIFWNNRRCLEFTGLSAEEMLGYGWMQVCHPDHVERVMASARRCFGNGEPYEEIFPVRRADGQYRWFLSRGVSQRDPAGRVICWFGTNTDITDRKQAETEVARLNEELQERVLRSAKELADTRLLQGISATLIEQDRIEDLYEKIVDAAAAIMGSRYASLQMLYPERGRGGELRLLAFRGFSPEAAHFWEWVDADSESTCGIALRTGERVIAPDVLECRFMAGSGDLATYLQTGIRAVQTTPLVTRNGKLVGMMSTHWDGPHFPSEKDLGHLDILARQAADLIERKQVKTEIQKLNAELERRVEERTAELMAANRELEGFTFAASHDLRGPLGRINSFSAMLEQRYRDRLEGEGLLFLEFIRQNAVRVNQLVDDLLHHARISHQDLALKPIDVLARILVVQEEIKDEIRSLGADVRIDVPPVRVLADSQALTQALSNLLQNALKYSAASSPPVIEISGKVRGSRFLLWIRDNGIGFDMAYHDKIFEIFRRLHTHSQYEGSGVGLALVKRAMERMGGRVWAESQPGKGATFLLELQLADPEGSASP